MGKWISTAEAADLLYPLTELERQLPEWKLKIRNGVRATLTRKLLRRRGVVPWDARVPLLWPEIVVREVAAQPRQQGNRTAGQHRVDAARRGWKTRDRRMGGGEWHDA